MLITMSNPFVMAVIEKRVIHYPMEQGENCVFKRRKWSATSESAAHDIGHERTRMSTSYRTYVGPYVRCVVETIEVTRQWDMIEEIGEELTPAFGDAYNKWVGEHSAHIWVTNTATPGRNYHLNNRVDFALAEITPDLVRQEIAQLEAQFAPALAVFRSRYGAGAVTLCWGIVQDYS